MFSGDKMIIEIMIISVILLMIAFLMIILVVETLHTTKNISKKRKMEKRTKLVRMRKKDKSGIYLK